MLDKYSTTALKYLKDYVFDGDDNDYYSAEKS
jgi:hypothetical protein